MGTQTLASNNVQTVEQLYAAFERGDIAHVLAALHPQVEWIEPEGGPYPGTFHGPDAVLTEVFAKLGGEWDGFRVMPGEFLDAGGDVVTLGRYTGTFRATGKSINVPFAHVWTMQDGKAVRFRVYTDTRKMAEAM